MSEGKGKGESEAKNLLFLTLCEYTSIREKDLYTDLLRVFLDHGWKVYTVSPVERRKKEKTRLIREGNSVILRLKTGNVQKTNAIEKGISTVAMETLFKAGIRKYFPDIRFDLVLYSTPPITLVGAVEYVKKRDGAKTYLLLKDIFPQNAADMGMLPTEGPKGALYRFFREKERKLYRVSDRIGCMSPANVRYVLEHNPEIPPEKVEVCPNSTEIVDMRVSPDVRAEIRRKYGIPEDRVVFVYGGNLGKPQGIPFVIECLRECAGLREAFFLIAGDGTEYGKLEQYARESRQENFRLMNRLPREDYDTLAAACDVGLIFLDWRFTIPNFPSRLISCMQAGLPVIACTDACTDVGEVAEKEGFGWRCPSNDAAGFRAVVEKAMQADLREMGEKGRQALARLYDVREGYEIITR